ncbi:hypothetical protein GCM10009535_16380 [Streptomyces thermocarboxydovorans]|uniref:Sigma-like protein n=1 Tax=Streptomyces thermocarboxydovorans TaxID=59298 RepID=A0ABP3SKE3_9ACTN
MSDSKKIRDEELTTQDNHAPVPPANGEATTQDNHAPTPPADGDIVTLDNHAPVPPALDRDGK